MKTSKLYFCLNAKTEIRMFNANGTKTILIAPLSCKLGPNDYQTTLDKWIDVYSTNDGKLRKINVHKIFLFSCFDNNWNHRDTLGGLAPILFKISKCNTDFYFTNFQFQVHSDVFNHNFSTVKYLPVLVRMKCYLKYTPTSKQSICKV